MTLDAFSGQRDALTNLLGRGQFLFVVSQRMKEASRTAIIVLNLDRFRLINAHLSFADGDAILRNTALRITRRIPETGVASRLSADEYAVALFDDDAAKADHIAELLRAAVAEPHAVGGMDVIVTASVGVAEGGTDTHADELLRRADEAMRTAKRLGSNQVRRDRGLMEKDDGLPPLLVETMLRQALQNGELEIHYQPKIHTRSMQVVGAEALCRWTHPELGHIPPQAFIPVAESSDLILPIDAYVLRKVCEQGASWMKQGYRVRISVNVSSRQFMQDGFPQLVQTCLAETGMDPQLIELEITERTAMCDVDRAVHVLQELRKIGVRIALDDFGVGYSSLNYLIQFPVHTLKIDRTFTAGIQSAVNQTPIIGAIISLAKSLNLSVVAEGVETFQQFDFLRENRCDEIQGFLFGAPVPPSSFQLSAFVAKLQPRAPQPDRVGEIHTEPTWLDRLYLDAKRLPDWRQLASYLADSIAPHVPLDRLSMEWWQDGAPFVDVCEVSLRDEIPARPVGTLVPVSSSAAPMVTRAGVAMNSPDILSRPEFDEDDRLAADGIRSVLRVPLVHLGQPFGILTVQSALERVYTDADRQVLTEVALRIEDVAWTAYQRDRALYDALCDARTCMFHRAFLAEWLCADDPVWFLSRAMRRPYQPFTHVTASVLRVEPIAEWPPAEAERIAQQVGHLWHTYGSPGAPMIRMDAGEFLLLSLNGEDGSFITFLEQLRVHLRVVEVRNTRLGSPYVSVVMGWGECRDTWPNLWSAYLEARRQALSRVGRG
ncbi:EAL domain-containing protein [Alicyclobacillus vulcanalis]|uniref:Diguanylate cyclase (GGDEF) domain-containing protein n=1 Tax=Alicyclobacillus vulcanalis TaxID=252246 RepID=A0A1N7P8U5_9BACL|nr:EAL domain-containing protein [Alicyclobacillus vulcanalis]SIT06957.1 diguanylate cyclase (GGDEF) domain-containing protein [Alicyclobacillus vulcanalis]